MGSARWSAEQFGSQTAVLTCSMELLAVCVTVLSASLAAICWLYFNVFHQDDKHDNQINIKRKLKKNHRKQKSVESSSEKITTSSATRSANNSSEDEDRDKDRDRERELNRIKLKCQDFQTENDDLKEKCHSINQQFEVLQEDYNILKKSYDQNVLKIINLENFIRKQEQIISTNEEEKVELEKLLRDQQIVIKLALSRIFPTDVGLKMCPEHVDRIRKYQSNVAYRFR